MQIRYKKQAPCSSHIALRRIVLVGVRGTGPIIIIIAAAAQSAFNHLESAIQTLQLVC